jgi:hypothetical protein
MSASRCAAAKSTRAALAAEFEAAPATSAETNRIRAIPLEDRRPKLNRREAAAQAGGHRRGIQQDAP